MIPNAEECTLLVLTRKVEEVVHLVLDLETLALLARQIRETGEPVILTVKVVDTHATRARLGFEAPTCVKILREEVNPSAFNETTRHDTSNIPNGG